MLPLTRTERQEQDVALPLAVPESIASEQVGKRNYIFRILRGVLDRISPYAVRNSIRGIYMDFMSQRRQDEQTLAKRSGGYSRLLEGINGDIKRYNIDP